MLPLNLIVFVCFLKDGVEFAHELCEEPGVVRARSRWFLDVEVEAVRVLLGDLLEAVGDPCPPSAHVRQLRYRVAPTQHNADLRTYII